MTEKSRSNLTKDWDALPSWARVMFALLALIGIAKFLPIVQILEVFLWVVCIPLVFLLLAGWLSAESFRAFRDEWRARAQALTEPTETEPVETPPPG